MANIHVEPDYSKYLDNYEQTCKCAVNTTKFGRIVFPTNVMNSFTAALLHLVFGHFEDENCHHVGLFVEDGK